MLPVFIRRVGLRDVTAVLVLRLQSLHRLPLGRRLVEISIRPIVLLRHRRRARDHHLLLIMMARVRWLRRVVTRIHRRLLIIFLMSLPTLSFSVNVLELILHPLKVGRLHRPVSVGLLQGGVLPVMMLMSIVLEYLRCLCWVYKIFRSERHILRQLGVIYVQLGPLGVGLQQLASTAPRCLLPQDVHYLLQQVLAVLRLLVLELL
jgi:hypothetical protein